MPSRWHHGHSLGAGALLGLGAASYRIWLLLAVAFLIGCAATVFILNGSRLVRWIAYEVESRRKPRGNEA